MTPGEKTIDLHDRYMTLNYPRYTVTMTEGLGCNLKDSTGKQYLDLFAGFGAGILGHCHPDLVAAATRQVNKLWHVGNLLHTEPQTQLAEHIANHGFGGRSYFCHSGSDANEAAFKIARLYGRGKRHKIIATLGSFHGRGFASMMATGQDKVREGFAPYLPGFDHVPYNDLLALKRAVDDDTIAIIVEPIQGEGGVILPDPNYLPAIRELCDERDILLIVDEVWTGCGRTGHWFAYQASDIEPDILTLGKAVGCGLAVGVMCASQKVAECYDVNQYGGVPHATTLGGNCVAMAVSAKLFEVIERDNLLERATQLGKRITDQLNQTAQSLPAIAEVRGAGLFIGIELNPEGAWFDDASDIVDKCMDQGLLIGSAQQNVLRLAPPLVVTDEQIDQGLQTLTNIIRG